MKKRTPSSRATSTHRSIRLRYVFDDASISAFIPIGFEVSRRINRSPSRKSWPWTYVSEIGCTIPIPPASETAATSSGLLHGYIAPQISGTSIPAWRVSGVSSGEALRGGTRASVGGVDISDPLDAKDARSS